MARPAPIEAADEPRENEDAAERLGERESVPNLRELMVHEAEVLRDAHAVLEAHRAVGTHLPQGHRKGLGGIKGYRKGSEGVGRRRLACGSLSARTVALPEG